MATRRTKFFSRHIIGKRVTIIAVSKVSLRCHPEVPRALTTLICSTVPPTHAIRRWSFSTEYCGECRDNVILPYWPSVGPSSSSRQAEWRRLGFMIYHIGRRDVRCHNLLYVSHKRLDLTMVSGLTLISSQSLNPPLYPSAEAGFIAGAPLASRTLAMNIPKKTTGKNDKEKSLSNGGIRISTARIFPRFLDLLQHKWLW